jgi:indoleamine 2,3-dioxygenase
MVATIRLEDFDVDHVRGFVPARDPLLSLPPYFNAWDDVAAQLPLLTMTGRTRQVLQSLPVLDASRLEDIHQQRRALLLLAGFANTWMAAHRLANEETAVIPRGVAIPLIAVSRALGMMPISTHATVVLGNWRRIDPAAPLSMDNVDTLLSFRGSIDEKWFFLSTVGVELAGAPVLQHLIDAVAAAEASDHTRLAAALVETSAIIGEITTAFMRVRESCDPYIFYNHVRPYLAGWPAPGVTYEGTGIGPVQYNGGSAAQSSLLQAIDAALGIRHDHGLTKTFLMSMRDYMPPRHRAFIETIGARSRVRARVTDTHAPATLCQAYDAAVTAMDELRRKHIGLVSHYITKQMPKDASAVGTGGTDFDDFLRQSRIETVGAKLGTGT